MTRKITTKLIVIILSVMMLTTSLLLPYAVTTSANELPVAQGELNDLTDKTSSVNLIDFNLIKDLSVVRGIKTITNNSITITSTDIDSYIVIGFISSGILMPSYRKFLLPCKPSTNYTFSVEGLSPYGNFYYGFLDSSYEFILLKGSSSNVISFISPSNASFIQYRFGVGLIGKSTTFKNLQINEGTTALPYEQYLSSIQGLTYSYNGATQMQNLYYYNYITLKKWIDTYMSIFFHGESTIKVWSDETKSNLLYTCTNATKDIDYKFTSKVFIEVSHKSLTEVADFDGLLGLADILFGGLFSVVNLSLKVLFNDIRLFTIPIGFYFMAVILIGIVFSIMNKLKGG